MFLKQKGQSLVTLLVFMAIAMAITAASMTVLLNTMESGTKYSDSLAALAISESGAENGLLRLVRNPNYTGEALTVGEGTATIEVNLTYPMTIVSTGKVRNNIKQNILEIVYNIGILNVVSWKEF